MKKAAVFNFLKVLFFLGIGLFSIWWFLRLLTPDEKKEIVLAFGRAKYGWLIVSMFVGLISHYLRTLRWNMLIHPLGYKPAVVDTFAAIASGYIGNFIIPRFGELLRCYVLKRTSGVPVTSLFGTVIVERVLDMLVFLIMFIFGLYVFLRQLTNVAAGYVSDFINGFTPQKIILLVSIAFLGLIILILMYLFRKKLNHKPVLGKVYSLAATFRNGLFSLLKIKNWPLFIIYTILIWVCYLLMTWLCFMALDETKHLSLIAAFASLTFGTVGIIVVQGGIGVYPAIVAQTLVIFGISSSIGYTTGWLTWLAQTVILLLMGIWAVYYLMFRKGIKIHDIRTNQTEDSNTESVG